MSCNVAYLVNVIVSLYTVCYGWLPVYVIVSMYTVCYGWLPVYGDTTLYTAIKKLFWSMKREYIVKKLKTTRGLTLCYNNANANWLAFVNHNLYPN